MQNRKLVFERAYMSTLVRLTLISNLGTIETSDLVEDAFDQFEYVTKKFSRFDKKSELSKLNSSPKNKYIKISAELFDLIDFALRISKQTNGAYDPTIIDFLELYGYTRENNLDNLKNLGLYEEVKRLAKSRHKASEIRLKPEVNEIWLNKGQSIDLGGIGKGYAIDLAYKTLNTRLDSFLINAGGDIRAKGKNESGKPWLISLARELLPNKQSKLNASDEWGKVELYNQALAASGRSERKSGIFHHLIDARTGLPVNNTHQVFVIANDAKTADAWATALFVAGKDGIDLIPTESHLNGILIDHTEAMHPFPSIQL